MDRSFPWWRTTADLKERGRLAHIFPRRILHCSPQPFQRFQKTFCGPEILFCPPAHRFSNPEILFCAADFPFCGPENTRCVAHFTRAWHEIARCAPDYPRRTPGFSFCGPDHPFCGFHFFRNSLHFNILRTLHLN